MKKKILIVDDDAFVLQLLYEALKEKYNVLKASCVSEAIETHKNVKADLIITDIIMPDQDGIQLIDSVRKNDKQTPIIAISGGEKELNNADQYVDFALYFADDTLKKPFSKSELLWAVETTLNNDAIDLIKYL